MFLCETSVNFSVSPRPEIGVLLLELGVGLVSLVSHMVRVRAMLCMWDPFEIGGLA